MALVLEILLGVMILASFYFAYMSAKNWPVYQAVVVVFLFLGIVGYFYLAARVLATHKNWRTLVQNIESDVKQKEQRLEETIEGGPADAAGQPVKGTRQLKRDLETATMERGSVIYEAAVDSVKEGVVTLTLKSPDHGLVAESVVFAFDEAPKAEGGRYRGEFQGRTAAEASPAVEIVSNLPLSESEAESLANAKGPWTLYVSMPVDDAAVFANLDEATRQAMLPAESVAEFGKADRTLYDYESFFRQNHLQRALLEDAIHETTGNLARTTANTEETQREITYRQKEQGDLKSDLTQFQQELQAITTYEQSLVKLHADVRQMLLAVYGKNKQLAADLTVRQLKAAEEINRRAADQANAAPRAVTARPR